MPEPVTPIAFALLAGLALSATVLGARGLRRGDGRHRAGVERLLLWGIAAICALLAGARWGAASPNWGPLTSHADGLLVMGGLLAVTVAFLRSRGPFAGLGAFASPVLALVFAWGICASVWTWRPFAVDSLWLGLHLVSVYAGAGFLGVAAGAAALYLYVHRRLARKAPIGALARLAPLEATERLMGAMTTAGFALLSLGLAAGFIVVHHFGPQGLGPGWWYSPKVLVAAGAWALYAVVVNVRQTMSLRGARAAWLSLAGFALLAAAFGLGVAMPGVGAGGGAP